MPMWNFMHDCEFTCIGILSRYNEFRHIYYEYDYDIYVCHDV